MGNERDATRDEAASRTIRQRLSGVHGRTYAREKDAIVKEIATTYARAGDAQARFAALANSAKTNSAADAFLGATPSSWGGALFTAMGARLYISAYSLLSPSELQHAARPVDLTQAAWDRAALAAFGMYGSALQERPAAALVAAFLLKGGSAHILSYGQGVSATDGDVVFKVGEESSTNSTTTEHAFMQLPLEERREWQRRATHEIYQAAARALWASLDKQFNTPNPSDAAEFAALRCGPDESPDSFALRFKELAAFEHTLSEEGKTRAFAQKLCACARFKDYHAYYMTHMRSHRERAGPGSLVAFEWSHVTIDDHASLARQFLEDQLRQPRTAPAAGTALTAAQIASLPHGEVQRLTQALLKANPALRAVVNAAQHQPGSPAAPPAATPAVALAATPAPRRAAPPTGDGNAMEGAEAAAAARARGHRTRQGLQPGLSRDGSRAVAYCDPAAGGCDKNFHGVSTCWRAHPELRATTGANSRRAADVAAVAAQFEALAAAPEPEDDPRRVRFADCAVADAGDAIAEGFDLALVAIPTPAPPVVAMAAASSWIPVGSTEAAPRQREAAQEDVVELAKRTSSTLVDTAVFNRLCARVQAAAPPPMLAAPPASPAVVAVGTGMPGQPRPNEVDAIHVRVHTQGADGGYTALGSAMGAVDTCCTVAIMTSALVEALRLPTVPSTRVVQGIGHTGTGYEVPSAAIELGHLGDQPGVLVELPTILVVPALPAGLDFLLPRQLLSYLDATLQPGKELRFAWDGHSYVVPLTPLVVGHVACAAVPSLAPTATHAVVSPTGQRVRPCARDDASALLAALLILVAGLVAGLFGLGAAWARRPLTPWARSSAFSCSAVSWPPARGPPFGRGFGHALPELFHAGLHQHDAAPAALPHRSAASIGGGGRRPCAWLC